MDEDENTTGNLSSRLIASLEQLKLEQAAQLLHKHGRGLHLTNLQELWFMANQFPEPDLVSPSSAKVLLDEFLCLGVDVDCIDCFGMTALHFSAAHGLLHHMHYLIERGSSAMVLKESKFPEWTPLDYAVMYAANPLYNHYPCTVCKVANKRCCCQSEVVSVQMVKSLCFEDCISASDRAIDMQLWLMNEENLENLLVIAVQVESTSLTRYLLKHLLNRPGRRKGRLRSKALPVAAQKGLCGMVRCLLDEGVHPDSPLIVKVHSIYGRNVVTSKDYALHYAAKRQDHASVKMLLERGASVHLIDSTGTVPLNEACEGDISLASLLLDAGADVNFLTELSPLVRTIQAGNTPVLRLLLQHGADVHWLDEDGSTLLDYLFSVLTHFQLPPMLQYLLEAGADPDGTKVSLSPLLYRTPERSMQHLRLVCLLLQYGHSAFKIFRTWCDECKEVNPGQRSILQLLTEADLDIAGVFRHKAKIKMKYDHPTSTFIPEMDEMFDEYSRQPYDLQQMCRIVIRKCLKKPEISLWKCIDTLHLPNATSNFLKMKHLDSFISFIQKFEQCE